MSEALPAFEIVNASGKADVLLICDHASNSVPNYLDGLGLSSAQLLDHIAWDPGAAAVARRLSQLLDAPLVLSGHSRLVVDCNRPLDSDQLIPEISDGVAIPTNQNLSAAERSQRINQFFKPYHDAIEALLDERQDRSHPHPIRALMSIHSFTKRLQGVERPWHIGVSHKNHVAFAVNLHKQLQQNPNWVVGLNQPYAIEDAYDYSVPHHGDARSIAALMIEMRQDQLKDGDCIETFARAIARAYQAI